MIPAPGAPFSGLAAPLSTPPSPSPNHRTSSDQATEAARAGRSVGRNAMPSPVSSWIAANQQAQIIAQQVSGLLPGHPAILRHVPLSAISGLGPKQAVTMPAGTASGGTVTLTPGQPHLVVFFATWLTETSDLKAELTGLNTYARAARRDHLPPLTAVDEAVTEPAPDAVRGYLQRLGTPSGHTPNTSGLCVL